MKRLLLILILTLSFQSWTKADDIKDFEIEGMSLGDSLKNFYSQNEIDKALQFTQYLASDKFLIYTFRNEKRFETYDSITVDLKKNDQNYEIYAISGILNFKDNMKECYALMKTISLELKDVFKNAEEYKVEKNKLAYDKSGKSFQRYHSFELPSGDRATIECNDWSNEVPNLSDSIMVSLLTSEYSKFLDNEAY